MRVRYFRLLAGTAAGFAAVTSCAALAQENMAQDGEAGLQDIIVTAQKRSESGQRVPISIVSIGSAELERAAITSLAEISRLTPGLQFQQNGSSSIPYLRGIGSSSSIAGVEAAAALVVDGVYLTSQTSSNLSLPSVETVEVDKGPQGTLFGRNAVSGVIQVRTRNPSHNAHVDITAGYGSYDTVSGSFYATGGLTDTVAMNISLYGDKQFEGWGKNLFTGKDVGSSRNLAGRAKLLFEPSKDTSLLFVVARDEIKTDLGFSTRIPAFGELGQIERGAGGYQFTGGFYDVALNYPSFFDSKSSLLSANFHQHFGQVDFHSITAYQYVKSYGQVDFDLTPNFGSHQVIALNQKTFSQEFTLASAPDVSGPFSWQTGIFLYHDIARYDPQRVIAPSATVEVHSRMKTTSYAIFGQGTYDLPSGTHITLGLRYTKDRRELDATNQQVSPTPLLLLAQTGEKSFSKLTYRASLSQDFTPHILGYASVARGFKAGFFNNQALQSVVGQPNVAQVVKPEVLDAYEVGFKTSWLNNHVRFNVSAFYYDYKDQQVNAFEGALRRIVNAASSHIKGIDFDLTSRIGRNLDLRLSGEILDAKYASFPNAPFFTPRPAAPFGNAVAPGDASGFDVIQSPPLTLTAQATYTIPLKTGRLLASGSIYYNDGFYWDFRNRLHEDSYTYVDASLRYEADDRWDLTLWGKNLTGAKVLSSANATGGGDSLTPRAPFTFGARVGVHF